MVRVIAGHKVRIWVSSLFFLARSLSSSRAPTPSLPSLSLFSLLSLPTRQPSPTPTPFVPPRLLSLPQPVPLSLLPLALPPLTPSLPRLSFPSFPFPVRRIQRTLPKVHLRNGRISRRVFQRRRSISTSRDSSQSSRWRVQGCSWCDPFLSPFFVRNERAHWLFFSSAVVGLHLCSERRHVSHVVSLVLSFLVRFRR